MSRRFYIFGKLKQIVRNSFCNAGAALLGGSILYLVYKVYSWLQSGTWPDARNYEVIPGYPFDSSFIGVNTIVDGVYSSSILLTMFCLGLVVLIAGTYLDLTFKEEQALERIDGPKKRIDN